MAYSHESGFTIGDWVMWKDSTGHHEGRIVLVSSVPPKNGDKTTEF